MRPKYPFAFHVYVSVDCGPISPTVSLELDALDRSIYHATFRAESLVPHVQPLAICAYYILALCFWSGDRSKLACSCSC